LGRRPDYKEVQSLFGALQRKASKKNVVLSAKDLTSIIIKGTGLQESDELVNKINASIKKRKLPTMELDKSDLDHAKLKVMVGEIEIKGTSKALKENLILESEGDEYKVTIRGSRLNVTTVAK
ncbi:MAG: hypothetical protein KAR20_24370, partial [Candidatus Heimdallarchaeota archaeon]|nr:hypothetical protein [Candidatus Heimdallarchaeota archaeon]